jgi:hypothetical protein
MGDKIKRFFDRIDTLWNGFKRGIKNLIIWFPTIWRDRQWDHQFIYMMLRAKLNFQEKFIRKHGIHVNNIEDANQIKECVDILDRLIDDDYHIAAFKEHDERWGEAKMSWIDTDEKENETDESDLVELNITYPFVETDQDLESERDDFKLACTKEDYLRQKDMRNLFLNMYKNIQGWWD